MSETNFFEEMLCTPTKKAHEIIYMNQKSSKLSLGAKCDYEVLQESYADEEFSRPARNCCEDLSSSLNNINSKQVWKSGTEKLSQTLSNVRNTFGVISQRIKTSIKKRSLVSTKSPRTPITPYTRSKAVLGRTPTKLYSPFSIDTPTGKEKKSNSIPVQPVVGRTKYQNSKNMKIFRDENHLVSRSARSGKTKLWKTRLNMDGFDDEKNKNIPDAVLSKDLLQTPIKIYELHSVAKKIAQNRAIRAKRF